MQLWHFLLLLPVVYCTNFGGQYENERNSRNQSVIYNCTELKNLTTDELRNASLYPSDCRYYCDRRSDAQTIQYGYYDVGNPCTNSSDVFDEENRIKFGTCITSSVTRKTIMKCDLNQPPPLPTASDC
uniref:7 cysteine domain n=1 Tax=Argas monolakensis TaxID=34602 RepID=Q09JR6_ARGMO|nr:7 cysteine domain [Argas monolakensis]